MPKKPKQPCKTRLERIAESNGPHQDTPWMQALLQEYERERAVRVQNAIARKLNQTYFEQSRLKNP